MYNLKKDVVFMKKVIYFNSVLRLIFVVFLGYLYSMLIHSTSDLSTILLFFLPCLFILVFIGFFIIDYFSLKKAYISLRFVLLTSFLCSLVCFFMIFSDSSDLIGRILFSVGSFFLPSIFSYFLQQLVATL